MRELDALELILKILGALGVALAGVASFFKWMVERADKRIAALEATIERLRSERK